MISGFTPSQALPLEEEGLGGIGMAIVKVEAKHRTG